MPIEKLKSFLDGAGVKYVTISHSRAYTAQEAAASAHIPGQELAKTVMVKLNGMLAMAVVPASYNVDLDLLGHVAGVAKAELAKEHEFAGRFPQCDTGAMPPFGNLYGFDVYVAESLAEDNEIAFAAGSHTELVRMRYDDFERLVRPKVLAFSEPALPH